MRSNRRKVNLPVLQLTELADRLDPHAIERTIMQGKGHAALTYYYRIAQKDGDSHNQNYNLFPVVLDKHSAPWRLATLFILDQLEGESAPVMATAHSRADDLGAFKEWIDTQEDPETLLFHFPKPKLRRTTYRFRGFLQTQIQAREIGSATAKRRMGTVISFYRWLIKNNYLNPTYPTWEEKEFHLSFTSMYGKRLSKTVRSTDLRIQVPKAENDFDGTIQDGGKLTPLTEKEQDWLIEAAEEKGNTECLLIQLFMLGTGARIESACTLRLSQFTKQIPTYSKSLNGDSQVCRLKAGPGTGIETKNNKNGTFQIPRLLYELLQVYACSKRAQLRRNRYITKNGEHSDIYLFLTQQGSPYYRAKTESRQFDANFKQRHAKNGQPIRQFIAEHAIPYVRDKYELSFFYRPHDLRASYGMNVNEELMKLVENGKISLHKARLTLKELLWHSSLSTTDLYLNYTKNRNAFSAAVDGFGQNLQRWANKAKCGLDIDE